MTRVTRVADLHQDTPGGSAWRLTRAILRHLRQMGMPRANLLLIGTDGMVRDVVEALLPDLRTPIAIWSADQPLELPPPGKTGTLLLHGVGALTVEEQARLLEWLEHAAGQTQVVSSTLSALLPLVQTGLFGDTLYYRLNVLCVDLTDPDFDT